MMCCPLSGAYGDHPSCSTTSHPRARKQHQCGECYEEIPAGAKYEKTTGVWDGHPSTHKTCLSCAEIRDHFACGEGYAIGEVWNDLEENFFPEMKAGGPCMDGLSPAAKGRLFEMRTKWLLESGQEIDGAPPPTKEVKP